MHVEIRRGYVIAALAALMAGAAGARVRASSVVPMAVSEMADHAAAVVMGRVVSIEPRWAENPRRIESTITFEQVEYLKGTVDDDAATLSLVVPGGEIDGVQMRIGCAPTFEVGGQYLLFVLPQYKTHPVVGLWQGAFRVVEDEAGVARVFDAGGRGVTGIDGEGFVRSAGAAPRSAVAHLHDVENVHVLDAAARGAPAAAMALGEFVERLRPVLAASRVHPLAGPAGQREAVAYTPTALRRSLGNEARGGAAPPPPRGPAAQEAVREMRTERGAAQEAQR